MLAPKTYTIAVYRSRNAVLAQADITSITVNDNGNNLLQLACPRSSTQASLRTV